MDAILNSDKMDDKVIHVIFFSSSFFYLLLLFKFIEMAWQVVLEI